MATAVDSELLDVLEHWKGRRVVVRVVSATDDLLAVCVGRLQARSDEKHPALYWPLESPQASSAERSGFYLHPHLFEEARIHIGHFVVEYRQAGVTVNVRLVDPGL